MSRPTEKEMDESIERYGTAKASGSLDREFPVLNTPTDNLLEATKQLLGNVRQNLVKVAANLVILRETDDRPWAEVCEDLDISQGFASKLTLSYSFFVIENGLEPERLADIDTEKLYLSLKTPGSAEEKLSRAANLTRGELRLDVVENHFGVEHEHVLGEERWGKCNDCESFVRI